MQRDEKRSLGNKASRPFEGGGSLWKVVPHTDGMPNAPRKFSDRNFHLTICRRPAARLPLGSEAGYIPECSSLSHI